jgi:Icc protein
MKLTWLTDIHLNFLSRQKLEAFIRVVADTESDAILITGDIGEAKDAVRYHETLARRADRPVYFVLGNHDFYRGSIDDVRASVEELSERDLDLTWIPHAGIIKLTQCSCLIGHDGWGDAQLGNWSGSRIALSDWSLISEFIRVGERGRIKLLRKLGEEAAKHLEAVLPAALSKFQSIIVATPVLLFGMRAGIRERSQMTNGCHFSYAKLWGTC